MFVFWVIQRVNCYICNEYFKQFTQHILDTHEATHI